MNKNRNGNKKQRTRRKISKIDQIVPFEDDLDYIRDSDGDYGLDEVRFRFEFEMSPDGKHIIRPVSEANPLEADSTHELLIREANLLGKAFGFTDEQIKKLFKELFRTVYAWYVSTGYPLEDLRKLVSMGYFKHPEEIAEFVLLIDDFTNADEVVHQLYEPITDRLVHAEPDEILDEDDEDTGEAMSAVENSLSHEKAEFVLCYDYEKEYEILARLSEIKKQLKTETNPEVKERLKEERKALIARIYRMREEFLTEHGMTYEDFLLLKRENHFRNWGWFKYPIYNENEKNTAEDILQEKLCELRKVINALSNNMESEEEDSLRKLHEKEKRILKCLEKIRTKEMTEEEKKIQEIHKLINTVYRLGKNKNHVAYQLSQAVKAEIRKIKSRAMKHALYAYLNQAWKKRKERFEAIFNKYKNSQLSLPF